MVAALREQVAPGVPSTQHSLVTHTRWFIPSSAPCRHRSPVTAAPPTRGGGCAGSLTLEGPSLLPGAQSSLGRPPPPTAPSRPSHGGLQRHTHTHTHTAEDCGYNPQMEKLRQGPVTCPESELEGSGAGIQAGLPASLGPPGLPAGLPGPALRGEWVTAGAGWSHHEGRRCVPGPLGPTCSASTEPSHRVGQPTCRDFLCRIPQSLKGSRGRPGPVPRGARAPHQPGQDVPRATAATQGSRAQRGEVTGPKPHSRQ